MCVLCVCVVCLFVTVCFESTVASLSFLKISSIFMNREIWRRMAYTLPSDVYRFVHKKKKTPKQNKQHNIASVRMNIHAHPFPFSHTHIHTHTHMHTALASACGKSAAANCPI